MFKKVSERVSLKKLAGTLAACCILSGLLSVICLAQTVSVYCFFNASEKDSFWTTSEAEKNALQDPVTGKGLYAYTGEGWQVDTENGGGRVPVYRFYNDKTKDHFFTTSEQEKQVVEENGRTGKDDYVYEGIAWYAYTGGSWPVYRFFDEINFNHYYTANENEKAELLAGNNHFCFEGIGWYASGLGSNGGGGNGYAGISQLTAPVAGNAGNSSSGSNSGTVNNNQGNSSANAQGNISVNNNQGNNAGSTLQAKSDREIVELLDQALGNQHDPYGSFGVWQYGHRAEKYYYYSNREQRQPATNELWCFVGKSQGEGAIPIANVYVDIYTGKAVFDFVEDSEGFVEPDFPGQMQLW